MVSHQSLVHKMSVDPPYPAHLKSLTVCGLTFCGVLKEEAGLHSTAWVDPCLHSHTHHSLWTPLCAPFVAMPWCPIQEWAFLSGFCPNLEGQEEVSYTCRWLGLAGPGQKARSCHKMVLPGDVAELDGSIWDASGHVQGPSWLTCL